MAGAISEVSSPESESLRDLLELEAVEFPSTCGGDWSAVIGKRVGGIVAWSVAVWTNDAGMVSVEGASGKLLLMAVFFEAWTAEVADLTLRSSFGAVEPAGGILGLFCLAGVLVRRPAL